MISGKRNILNGIGNCSRTGRNRQRRSAGALHSELTEIPHVGAKRAAMLLKHFGSVAALRTATVEELLLVPMMTRPAAESIVQYFQSQS